MQTKVGLKRLRILSDLMKRIAADENRQVGFNMNVWCSHSEGDTSCSDRPGCGTSACAAGFAASNRALRAQGLRLHGGSPAFAGRIGTEALAKFFGCSEHHAIWFFMSRSYDGVPTITPLHVAKRIDAYLAEHK